MRLRPVVFAAFALAAAALPGSGSGFGTPWDPVATGQNSEHERMVRASLGCHSGRQPPRCFQPKSLEQLAGRSSLLHIPWNRTQALALVDSRTYGAVGLPDMFLWSGGVLPSQEGAGAHCDGMDYLEGVYPKSARTRALAAFQACREYIKGRFEEALDAAAGLVKEGTAGQPDTIDATTVRVDVDCRFSNRSQQVGRRKCLVIKGLGRAIHALQDFFAHTNWSDTEPSAGGIDSPPGLRATGRPPLLNMLIADAKALAAMPRGFTGSCYEHLEMFGPKAPALECANRIKHRDLNKDRGLIDPVTGQGSAPQTARGKVGQNFAYAVLAAVFETKEQWNDFRTLLVRRYKRVRADVLICAITKDDPVRDCQGYAPQLVGLSLAKTKATVDRIGFRLHVEHKTCSAAELKRSGGKNVVLAQSPARGTLVVPRSQVNVTVCSASTGTTPKPPANETRGPAFDAKVIVTIYDGLGTRPGWVWACDPNDPKHLSCDEANRYSDVRRVAHNFCIGFIRPISKPPIYPKGVPSGTGWATYYTTKDLDAWVVSSNGFVSNKAGAKVFKTIRCLI